MTTSTTWPGGSTNATPTSYAVPGSGEFSWAALTDFLNALASGAQSTTFQKFAVRKCLTTPVTVSAATDCIVVTQLTSTGAVTVNLPAGAAKQVFVILDGTGDAGTNTVTINAAGSDTIAGSASATLTHNREALILVFNSSDTDWKITRCGPVSSITSADITGAVLPPKGGTGIVNNSASTLTISGSYATTLTLTNTTALTLPTTGTLSTLAGSETLTNKAYSGTTLALSAQPCFNAYRNGAESGLALSAFNKVSFNTELFDVSSEFDTSLARFVAGTAGKYLFATAVAVGPGTNTTRIQLSLYKNGNKINIFSDLIYSVDTNNRYQGGSIVVSAAASDYFEIFTFVNGTGTYSHLSGSDTTWFSGVKVS